MNRFVGIITFSALLLLCTVASCSDPVELQVSCSTSKASDISFDAAVLNGTIVITNGSSDTYGQAFFYYSAGDIGVDELQSKGTKVSAGSVSSYIGSFSCPINGLTPSSNYSFMASVVIDGKEYLGSLQRFFTRDVPIQVKTTTTTTSGLTLFFNAEIETDLNEYSASLGFYYSETDSTIQTIIKNGTFLSAEFKDKNSFQSTHLTSFFGRKYHYVASAKISAIIDGKQKDFGTKYGDVQTIEVAYPEEVVDLGLSVRWRSWNLGAAKPEEYGGYFAWAETETKTVFTQSTNRWYDEATGQYLKYNSVDRKNVLDIEDDAARSKLGGPWRIPSVDEWNELLGNCEITRVSPRYGENGYVFRSIVPGHESSFIYIPYAGACPGEGGSLGEGQEGCYMTSNFSVSRGCPFIYVLFNASNHGAQSDGDRVMGYSIRPVME